MRKFLRRLLAESEPPGGQSLQDQLDRIERVLAEHHRRLLEVEAGEAVREAAHLARVDALTRLYKRVSQRFTDAPETSPKKLERPAEETPSVLELRQRLRK